MKLSVSNIAWEQDALEEHLQLLRHLGCDGVEIAPSCIWKEPVDAGKNDIDALNKLVSRFGLVIPAFHALLFTRPDLYLFGEQTIRAQTIAYLEKLIQLAGSLSVPVLVYGSPASRKIGDRPYETCYGIAVESFRKLGREAAKHNTFFCIEPLGPTENDFIRTADEANRLITDVGEPHFGLHLDARAMADAVEDFETVFRTYARTLKHFHVGDPGLAPPGFTGFDHHPIGRGLAASGYDGFISIEMKRGFGDSKKMIADAVAYVRQCYFKAGR